MRDRSSTAISDRSTEGEHELNQINRMQAEDRLRDAGWTLLGRGYYSSAWSHPDCPETVLKVGRLDIDGPDNDGWLRYVKTCVKTLSPHAPRVMAVEIYKTHFYAELERLTPMRDDEWVSSGLRYLRHEHSFSEIKQPSLKAYMRRVERLRRRTDSNPDMHAGNYMCRPGTGEIVCTDPWC